MSGRTQLVLDIAGVLLENMSPAYWQELASRIGANAQALKERFDQEIRRELWTGGIREEQFWEWLRKGFDRLDIQEAKALLQAVLKPLPALHFVKGWSRLADIHLLSNHCVEWVTPNIVEVKPYLTSLTISNQVGLQKPGAGIFRRCEEGFRQPGTVLFVDDQEKNLAAAGKLGWRTLRADPQHRWIEQVEPLLLLLQGLDRS